MVKRDDKETVPTQGRVRDTDEPGAAGTLTDEESEPDAGRYRPEMGTIIVRYERQDSEKGIAG